VKILNCSWRYHGSLKSTYSLNHIKFIPGSKSNIPRINCIYLGWISSQSDENLPVNWGMYTKTKIHLYNLNVQFLIYSRVMQLNLDVDSSEVNSHKNDWGVLNKSYINRLLETSRVLFMLNLIFQLIWLKGSSIMIFFQLTKNENLLFI